MVGTISVDDAKAELERWIGFYRRMRNIAAGFSNQCDENGTTRRLDREMSELEKEVGWPLGPKEGL
jgi:hypothetical protein